MIQPSKRTSRGFTLLEIMVATMILGLVMLSVYGVVVRALQSKNHAEARAELYAAGRETLILSLGADLEGALPPTLGAGIYFVGVSATGDGGAFTDGIEFARNIRHTKSSQQRRGGRAFVSYLLYPQPDSPRLFELYREVRFANQPTEEVVDGAADPEPPPLPTQTMVMDSVAGLKLEYFDPMSAEWVDRWDTTEEPQPGKPPRGLPAAVNIRLWLADERGFVQEFATRIDLVLLQPPPTPPQQGQAPGQQPGQPRGPLG